MEPQFKHPYSYDVAITKFYGLKSAIDHTNVKILEGMIKWSENSICENHDEVSKEVVFIAVDDTIGQINKISSHFGVTAFLEVTYKSKVALNSKSIVEVTVTKREKSRSGAMKTFCSLSLKSESEKIQAIATALFIDKKDLHNPKKMDLSELPEKFEIERLKPFNKAETKPNYHEMVKMSDREVTWIDGQGPKGNVHGGVMSIPVFHALSEKVSKIHINYKSPIPLGSDSELTLEKKGDQVMFSAVQASTAKIQFEGFVVPF